MSNKFSFGKVKQKYNKSQAATTWDVTDFFQVFRFPLPKKETKILHATCNQVTIGTVNYSDTVLKHDLLLSQCASCQGNMCLPLASPDNCTVNIFRFTFN